MKIRSISNVRQLISALIFVFFTIFPVSVNSAEQDALWSDLALENHFAMLRHAIAPGIGDPPEFDLNDCGTQRNLSEEGRKQARLIGQRFREKGFSEARIVSSQWCRCLETAKLLELGKVEELPVLNSFFADPGKEDEQTRRLENWLGDQDLSELVVLVTHQVNITALTGVYPRSGELVIVERTREGDLTVKGTVRTE